MTQGIMGYRLILSLLWLFQTLVWATDTDTCKPTTTYLQAQPTYKPFTSTHCPECEYVTTTYETVLPTLCSTGLGEETYTVTQTCPNGASIPYSTGNPPGFTSEVVVCQKCGATPITATVTKPTPLHTTVYETAFAEFCPTGTRSRTFTITEACSQYPCSAPSGAPSGFHETVATCTTCGPRPITATLTVPSATYTLEYETQFPAFGPTGLAPKKYTATQICSEDVCPISPGVPSGFAAETVVCTTCGPQPITATVTAPVAAAVLSSQAAGAAAPPSSVPSGHAQQANAASSSAAPSHVSIEGPSQTPSTDQAAASLYTGAAAQLRWSSNVLGLLSILCLTLFFVRV